MLPPAYSQTKRGAYVTEKKKTKKKIGVARICRVRAEPQTRKHQKRQADDMMAGEGVHQAKRGLGWAGWRAKGEARARAVSAASQPSGRAAGPGQRSALGAVERAENRNMSARRGCRCGGWGGDGWEKRRGMCGSRRRGG